MEQQEFKGKAPTVQVRLFATLRDGRGKTVDFPWHKDLTTGDIIRTLKIPPEEVSILLINGRDASPEDLVGADDYVSIFPPVGGG